MKTNTNLNFSEFLGSTDLVFITLDSLRYDAAVEAFEQNLTPEIRKLIPKGWERCHTPGNYTLPAHYAFFNGFLPTPVQKGFYEYSNVLYIPEPDEAPQPYTFILNKDTIMGNLARHGYLTICIGGTGFFSKKNHMGKIFTSMFQESYWTPQMSVSHRESTKNQVDTGITRLKELENSQRVFLFMNVSSTHQPSHIFLQGTAKDSVDSQKAAIAYSDKYIGELLHEFRKRADTFLIICSDHGEAFGEGGFWGHRNSHSTVMTIPYAETLLPKLKTIEKEDI